MKAQKSYDQDSLNPSEDRPFFWRQPNCYMECDCAPTGWYQWTKQGLVYLGESILDRA